MLQLDFKNLVKSSLLSSLTRINPIQYATTTDSLRNNPGKFLSQGWVEIGSKHMELRILIRYDNSGLETKNTMDKKHLPLYNFHRDFFFVIIQFHSLVF